MIRFLILITAFILFSCNKDAEDIALFSEKLYVCDQVTDQVIVLDASTDNLDVITTVPINLSDDNTLPEVPHFVAIDEASGYWFVTTIQGGYVGMYSLEEDTLISSIELGDSPALLAVEPVSQMLYVSRMMTMAGTQDGGSEYKINALDYSSGGLVQTDNICLADIAENEHFPEPHAISVYHHATRPFPTLVTASITEDWLSRIDLLGGNTPFNVRLDEDTPEMTGQGGGVLSPISVTQKDEHIFFSCSGSDGVEGQVRSYGIETPEDIENVFLFNTGSSPWHIVSSPTSSVIFVVLKNEGIASLSYNASGVLTQNWRVSNITDATLHGVTVSLDGTRVYVSGRGNGSVYVFDAATGSLLNTISAGYSLSGMAVTQVSE